MTAYSTTASLLESENPLLLLPALAEYIGLEFNTIGDRHALALKQVHYWLTKNKDTETKKPANNRFHYRDGRWWTYNTYKEWREGNFRFWKERLVRKIFSELENMGLLISEQFQASKGNQTKWYSIDYEALEALYIKHSSDVTQNGSRLTESVTPVSESVRSYTETSFTEITSETSFHIDTFSGGKSDTDESQNEKDLTNEQEQQSGTVSPTSHPDSRRRETHETQVEKPKKKMNWRPGKTLYYETDKNDRIIYPSIKDLHPVCKPYYSSAIAQADRDTKAWIINNGFVDAISVETNEDGEIYVETLNDEYTPQEALSEIPLAQLFQLGVHPDHGSLSASEYNEYWASRFIDYMEIVDLPL